MSHQHHVPTEFQLGAQLIKHPRVLFHIVCLVHRGGGAEARQVGNDHGIVAKLFADSFKPMVVTPESMHREDHSGRGGGGAGVAINLHARTLMMMCGHEDFTKAHIFNFNQQVPTI